MPCRRHTTGVHAPASASRKIPIICSSLNRLPFICPSPFSDGLYLQTVGREGGTPNAPLGSKGFCLLNSRDSLNPTGKRYRGRRFFSPSAHRVSRSLSCRERR